MQADFYGSTHFLPIQKSISGTKYYHCRWLSSITNASTETATIEAQIRQEDIECSMLVTESPD
jgi:hypothetical protein